MENKWGWIKESEDKYSEGSYGLAAGKTRILSLVKVPQVSARNIRKGTYRYFVVVDDSYTGDQKIIASPKTKKEGRKIMQKYMEKSLMGKWREEEYA